MNDLVIKALTEVPGLAVMAFIVWIFLKSMGKRDEIISEISKDNIEARTHSRLVIEKNSAVVAENTVAMNQMTGTFKDVGFLLKEKHL